MAFSPFIEDSFLDLESVKKVSSLSKTTIYGLISKGKFPPPIQICGARRVVWKASAINSWVTAQGDEP